MLTIAPLLLEAEMYLAQLDFDRAAALYQKAMELDDESPLPRIGIARIALAMGKRVEGAHMLDSVLQRHPSSVEALTIRGVAAETAGDLAEATSFLERAIEHGPTYGPAFYNLGRILAQQHQWRAACVQLRRASELMPKEPEVAVMYGSAAFRAGNLQESVEVLRRSIEAAPYSVGGYVTLADVLVEAGKLDLADRLLASAQERFSRQAIFPSKRAAIAMRRGLVDQALVHARKQVALAPNIDEGWLLIAVLEHSQLNLEGAEAALHEVLRRSPGNWRAHYHLGGIYESLRLRDLAQHAYRNAAQLAPQEWQPKNNLATLLLEHDDVVATLEARALLEHAMHAAPPTERFMPQFNLALACLKLGERAASERHAREAIRLAPSEHTVTESAKRFLENFA